MSETVPHNGRVEHFFGDAPYWFCLRIGDIGDLEQKTGVGIFLLWASLLDRSILSTHIKEILRIGLVGGGMDGHKAYLHTERWFQLPMIPLYAIALDVMRAAILAHEPVSLGKKKEAEEEKTASPSPTSTGPAARSATRRKKSTA